MGTSSAKAPPPLDLRAVSLRADVCVGAVKIEWKYDNWSEWLQFGQAALRKSHDEDNWLLVAYMSDDAVAGYEHGRVHLFRLPLIGVAFRWCDNHWTRLRAYIDPDGADDTSNPGFRVSGAATYDPRTHPKSRTCLKDGCSLKKPHVVVPDSAYLPPFDDTLFEAVRARRVEIILGVNFETEAVE